MTQPQTQATAQFGLGTRRGIHFKPLIDGIEELTQQVSAKIEAIRRSNGDGVAGGNKEISIAEMFELQMSMNKLTQFSEMSTGVLSGMNSAINTMAHNLKG